MNESKSDLGGLPSLDSQERRQGTTTLRTILIIQSAGGLHQAAQLVQAEFLMVGLSHLAWLSGHLMERPGEGYWLLFDHQLPVRTYYFSTFYFDQFYALSLDISPSTSPTFLL